MPPRPSSFPSIILEVRTACISAFGVVAMTMMQLLPFGVVVVVAAAEAMRPPRIPLATAFLKRKKTYTPLLFFKVPKGMMDECEWVCALLPANLITCTPIIGILGGGVRSILRDDITESKYPGWHLMKIFGVASWFGISVRYWSVFSWYFPNQYQRKTRSGRFGIIQLAGTPFFPSKGGFCPLFDGPSPPFEGNISSRRIYKKEFPQNFTKWSSAKSYSTKIPNRIYWPASAGNLPIPAKLPVNR